MGSTGSLYMPTPSFWSIKAFQETGLFDCYCKHMSKVEKMSHPVWLNLWKVICCNPNNLLQIAGNPNDKSSSTLEIHHKKLEKNNFQKWGYNEIVYLLNTFIPLVDSNPGPPCLAGFPSSWGEAKGWWVFCWRFKVHRVSLFVCVCVCDMCIYIYVHVCILLRKSMFNSRFLLFLIHFLQFHCKFPMWNCNFTPIWWSWLGRFA